MGKKKRAGESAVREGQNPDMLSYTLMNLEIQKYHQNEPTFSSIYSRNNLPKIKDGVYVINPGDYKSVGTHLIALYVNGDDGTAYYYATYFDIFGAEHIS